MKKRTVVIMNESHSLLPQQEALLKDEFDTYEILPVPAEGWTREEMNDIHDHLTTIDQGWNDVVFVSPIPYLLGRIANTAGFANGYDYGGSTLRGAFTSVYLFHNDRREKRELPDGRIIMTVAREGWELISI